MKQNNRTHFTLGLLCLLFSAFAGIASAQVRTRTTTSFDAGWRFNRGESKDAEQVTFNDQAWRALDVPHDWSIEGPFDKDHPTRGSGGFLPAGIGWYRKHFKLPEGDANRRVFIEFDGIMANSDVWINGFHLGRRPYGYVSFGYELTGHLKFGDGDNVLAVRADNSGQPASRWYSGAGIYRHVRLVVTSPIHLTRWGTFVTTPQVTNQKATVHVRSTVINQSAGNREISVQVSILGPEGKTIRTLQTKAKQVPAGNSVDFDQDIVVDNPRRWDLEHPVLYQSSVLVLSGKTPLDEERVAFWISVFKI
jgi:beta-galactosidase